MFGGIIFSGTVTSVTRTVTIPGSNLRFYTDTLITNINSVEFGSRISIVPKGETKGHKHVLLSASSVAARSTGILRSILVSSGDTFYLARETLSTTVSQGVPGNPLIYTVQAREVVV